MDNFVELFEKYNRLVKQNKKLKEDLKKDSFTGIYNKKHLLNVIEKRKRQNLEMSIILCDIDYFKKLNDTLGHIIGDKAILAVVKAIKKIIYADTRHSDIILGRFGGEEFMIICPNTSLGEAAEVAERLRQTIEFETSVTMSFGVASSKDVDDVMTRADKALYSAKNTGRNKVIKYEPNCTEALNTCENCRHNFEQQFSVTAIPKCEECLLRIKRSGLDERN